MKTVWCSVLVAVGATLAWAELTSAGETEESKATATIHVRHVADGEDGRVRVVEFKGDGSDEDVRVLRFHDGGADGEHERVNLARVLHEVADDEVSENSGWLGVQLNITQNSENGNESTEVVVSNVAKDSAADVAGFEQNDVILEVDDVAIGGGMGDLVHLIRDAGPGKRVKFTVLRDGERRTLVATLGNRSEMGDVAWTYENEHEALFRESTNSRARVLLRGQDGSWTMEHLQGLDGANGTLNAFFPSNLDRTMNISIDGDETSISTSVSRDGVTITVERTGDGEIVVTRFQDGDESVEHYADEDALKAGDEEAFNILVETKGHMIMTIDGDLHGDPGGLFELDLDGDVNWLQNVEESLDLKGEELAEALEELKNIQIDVDAGTPHMAFFHGQARRSILENPDGTIDVTVRRGGDELVTRYADADDLRDRDPDMYERYLSLQSADVDE